MPRQIIPQRWKTKVRHFFLDLDARINSTLFSSGKGARELYERYSTFMDRFYVGRWKRWVFIEPLSEAATIGLGGLILLLALAVPGLPRDRGRGLAEEVRPRRHLPRPLRQRDRQPRHQALRRDPARRVAGQSDQGDARHRGPPLLRPFRHRHRRHRCARWSTNARAGGVRQGGSSITQQLAKNLFLSNERTIERKVKEAFLAIWLETRLSKNEILKLYLDRAYMGGGTFGVDGGGGVLFRQVGERHQPRRGRDAGRPVQGAGQVRPAHQPAGRARPRQRGARQPGRGRLHDRGPGDRRPPQPGHASSTAATRARRTISSTGPSTRCASWSTPSRNPYTERVFVVRTSIDIDVQHARRGRDRGPAAPVRPRLSRHAGGDRGVRARRRRARHGRRPRLWREPVQPRDRRLRQPGSSFKPYVYATAMLNGFKPTSIVVDGPICIGNWCPQNYGGSYSGAVTLTQAITRSINVVPVKLSIALGARRPKVGRAKIVADGAPLRHHCAAAGHAVAADRRRRGHRDRSRGRLCDLPERRQGGRRRMRCSKCAPAPAT